MTKTFRKLGLKDSEKMEDDGKNAFLSGRTVNEGDEKEKVTV